MLINLLYKFRSIARSAKWRIVLGFWWILLSPGGLHSHWMSVDPIKITLFGRLKREKGETIVLSINRTRGMHWLSELRHVFQWIQLPIVRLIARLGELDAFA